MKRLIFALMLSASPLAAQNVTVFTPKEGGGVVSQPGNVTPQEAAILMGDDAPPPGATGVVLEPGKPARWTTLSAEDVDREYKGNGDPERRLFPENEDPDNPKEIDLFPEEDGGSARIRPSAGTWIGKVGEQSFDGCTAAISGPIREQTAVFDNKPIQGSIGPSFTPPDISPELSWTQTSANGWVGDFDQTQNGFGMRMQWAVNVISPTLIENTQQIDVLIPGGGHCKVRTDVQYVLGN